APGERLVFAHQAEQQMLGLDGGRAKLRGFVTSKENYPARFFSVAFEHSRAFLISYDCRASHQDANATAHYSATDKRQEEWRGRQARETSRKVCRPHLFSGSASRDTLLKLSFCQRDRAALQADSRLGQDADLSATRNSSKELKPPIN